LFLSCCFVSSSSSETRLDEKIHDQIAKLNWQIGEGYHELSTSNATIITGKEDALATGMDAIEFMRLSEGHDAFRPDAVIAKIDGPLADSITTYDFNEVGYLTMADWEEHIDPTQILEVVKSNTSTANIKRAAGYPKIFVDGWLEEPKLDRLRATVYWAIRGHTDRGDQIVNARALKLGRKGYAAVTWMGKPDGFQSAASVLQPALNAYRYNEGARYADFKPGVDTVATFGVGAVVYKALTGSSKKITGVAGAGLIAIALAFAKKLWLLALLPFVMLWHWVKRLFRS
jgi:uncharacterized membrane-anchored protein